MCRRGFTIAVVVLSVSAVCFAGNYVKPTTTLSALTSNNTSAANSFSNQSNGNLGAANISKLDIHTLLYPGATTKIYAHLLLWFGESNHMNIGYSSTDPNQIHNQIEDMVSRGIDGVIIDWYGPGNAMDQATQLVMTEAEKHPGFTFAIMIDQGALRVGLVFRLFAPAGAGQSTTVFGEDLLSLAGLYDERRTSGCH